MILEILKITDYDAATKVLLLVALPFIILMSLSIHEFAHAVVSYSLGDPTAKSRGRLSLNPLKHLDPLGTLCMFLFGFGWARPILIDPRYYKNPKKGMALCGLAGPVVNALIGVSSFIVYSVLCWIVDKPSAVALLAAISFPEWLYVAAVNIFYILGYYNILLAVFNFMPIPPMDGSRIIYAVLPDRQYFAVMKHERIIMLVMLALLWIGVFDLFFDAVLTVSMNGIYTAVFAVLDRIAAIF